jgi:hypothetical protein
MVAFVQKHIQPRSGRDAHVMLAFWANAKISFQLRVIKNCITARAFIPQSFGHSAFLFDPSVLIVEGINFSNQLIRMPHRISSSYSKPCLLAIHCLAHGDQ